MTRTEKGRSGPNPLDDPNATAGLPWADLVFHVLAHVLPTAAVAASVYDPVYVRFAARHIGCADDRLLGEDLHLLGRVLDTHSRLAQVQVLAWLFADVTGAAAARGRDLRELSVHDVSDPTALPSLLSCQPIAEVLRAAAELEAPHHSRLPWDGDRAALGLALQGVMPAAPFLGVCSVECVRSLRLRGRVRGRRIWVGLPSVALDLSAEHAAFQAGHEATVAELSELCREQVIRLSERAVEHAAVVVFAERAAQASIADAHARWFGHLGENTPSPLRAALGPDARRVVELARARFDSDVNTR